MLLNNMMTIDELNTYNTNCAINMIKSKLSGFVLLPKIEVMFINRVLLTHLYNIYNKEDISSEIKQNIKRMYNYLIT